MKRSQFVWFVLIVVLLTALAFVRINEVVRAATLGAWGSYLPVATEACPSVPSVSFCPAPVFEPTPTPEPIVGPARRMP